MLYEVITSDEASVSVQVMSTPEVPVISAEENVLSSTASATYQWYFNGNLIAGATSQTYTATETGLYQVEVTNASGCSNMSEEYSYVSDISGIDKHISSDVSVFPNPNDGIFEIVSERNNFV